jgi:hypothetical protein
MGTGVHRISSANDTGDSSLWLKIARNGEYSLIVRVDLTTKNGIHAAFPLETDATDSTSNAKGELDITQSPDDPSGFSKPNGTLKSADANVAFAEFPGSRKFLQR